MNVIQTKTRNSLTDDRLQNCMRIALTSYQTDFITVAQKHKMPFLTLIEFPKIQPNAIL